MKFLIKPFSEIMIKSKPVRKRQLSILQTNISLTLRAITSDIKVQLFWDKLEVNCNKELEDNQLNLIRKSLSRIPGIEFFLEVSAFNLPPSPQPSPSQGEGVATNHIYDFVFQKTKDFYLNKIENKSFVVRVKRSGQHNFTSIDLERYVGGGLLKLSKNARVKLKNPDIKVAVEIKDDNLFIIKDSFKGIGGYPVGTQDKVLSLISGGFDSGVSTFQMMKRGCRVDFLFFNLGGSAHELGVKQVSNYLWNNFSKGYKAKFITIPFEEVVGELLTKVKARYRAIILKRLFLMVADKIANNYEYYALVKGDSLGQVSSQTLKNMFVIDKATNTLVLRPLISYNKQDIIDITKQIGTYSFACNMPEYCGVVSDKPATGASLKEVLKEEQNFDFSLLDKAIEDKKVENIDKMLKDVNESGEIELSYVPGEDEVVIDIREEEKIIKNPLNIDGVEILQIPFFEIKHKFKDLDNKKVYLLYCDKGILSNLHGLYLKEQGYNNIKVYRPVDKGCSLEKK